MRRKMLVAMRPEVVDALELLLVEERGVEAREWVDEALLAVGQAKRLYAGEAPGIRVAPRAEKRYALNFCSNCGSRLNCEECVEPSTSAEREAEGRLLAELAMMSDDVLVEYVLQDDYYTPSHWEAVAQLELDRRGKGDLPKLKTQARCQHAPIFVHEGVCKACGKTGLR